MLIFVLCLSFLSPGVTDAMEANAHGELYLITFGRPSAEVFRDSVTGMRYHSLGCVVRDGDLEYMEDWNRFMSHIWMNLASDETFFSLRTETEGIEYGNGTCIYIDQWGSVPIELYPEELAHMVWLGGTITREEAENYGRLELLVPGMTDTLSVTVPLDTEITRELFHRGRQAIRVNTLN